METILRLGLGNAATAGLLALGAATVGLFAGRRPALRHVLWLLVLLKLVTPPLWWVPVSALPFPSAAGTAPAPAAVPAPAPAVGGPAAQPVEALGPELLPEDGQEEVAGDVPRDDPGQETDAVARSSGAAETSAASPEPPRAVAAIEISEPAATGRAAGRSWGGWLLAAWGVGSLLTFGLSAWRIARFRRLLRLAEPASGALRAEVEALADRLGLGAGRVPGVWQVPGEVSPMLWAPGCRPRLIVPTDLWERLDARQRSTLLAHELAHLKRRDHRVRGLELLATVLYWWLPVVWIARRALREAEEQCCDAWVVWAFPGSARAYAEALLETLDFLSGADPAAAVAASGLGPVHHLKRRLTMILKGTTPRALTRRGLLAVLGLSAAMLPMSVTWAQQRAKADAPLEDKPRELDATPPPAQAPRGTSAEERTFFEALRKDHKFDDPRWPYAIEARDVQGKTLIDAVFKRHDRNRNDRDRFDQIVRTGRADVLFDADGGTIHIDLDDAWVKVPDPRRDELVYIDSPISNIGGLEISLRQGPDAPGSAAVKERFFEALRSRHVFDDPRWPYVVEARDVRDDYFLIDATFKHRAGDRNDPDRFDRVVRIGRAVVAFDGDGRTAHVMLHNEAEHSDRILSDVEFFEKQILEIAIPAAGDAPEVEDDEAQDDDAEKPETRDPGPRHESDREHPAAGPTSRVVRDGRPLNKVDLLLDEYMHKAMVEYSNLSPDELAKAKLSLDRARQLAEQFKSGSPSGLREAIDELRTKLVQLVARKSGEPLDEREQEELKQAVQKLRQQVEEMSLRIDPAAKSKDRAVKPKDAEVEDGREARVSAKMRGEVERLQKEFTTRREALADARTRLEKAVKRLAEASEVESRESALNETQSKLLRARRELARNNPFFQSKLGGSFSQQKKPGDPSSSQLAKSGTIFKKKAMPKIGPGQASVKLLPRPDQEKRIAELEERLGKLQDEVKSLKKQESKDESPK